MQRPAQYILSAFAALLTVVINASAVVTVPAPSAQAATISAAALA